MNSWNMTTAALLAGSLLMSGGVAASGAGDVFSPAQEARIGEVAAAYLMAHPDVLVQVSQRLQAQQQAQQRQAITAAALAAQPALIQDKNTPAYGPADARVVVVEFFDYQCVMCARQAPALDAVMRSRPDVRFIFKAWPIFASRWASSLTAATVGLQIWQQKGGEAWLEYHRGLFATGHNEGQLTETDIQTAAEAVHFDAKRAMDVQETLKETDALARQMGWPGTPGLVVMPVSGATRLNTTVIPGRVDAATLEEAITRAGGDHGK